MKFRTAFIIPVLILAVATFALGRDDKREKKDRAQQVERTTSADSSVAVSVCLASGAISVRGWDRNEVRARSRDVGELEFRRRDATPESSPAKKIEVLISDRADGSVGRLGSCRAFSDIELDVPRGATVQLQTRDGNINVTDVAKAFVNTQSGDIRLERASQSVDAGCIGGNITLKDSSGRISLHSLSGSIEAIAVRPGEAADSFDASSVSGDIVLDRVGHAQVNARTTSGSVSMSGPLAHTGNYGFKTLSGDLTLTLPADSSFKLSAKVSQNAEIITDFPVTLTTEASTSARPPAPPAPATPPTDAKAPKDDGSKKGVIVSTRKVVVVIPGYRHFNAIYGTGDATIYVASFSGTIHLRKK
jgi:DUF4097 and DUF4098 domain-containing protein YvlB